MGAILASSVTGIDNEEEEDFPLMARNCATGGVQKVFMEEVVGFPTTSGNGTSEEKEVGFLTKSGKEDEDDSIEVGFLSSSGTGEGKVDSIGESEFCCVNRKWGKNCV